MKRIITTLLITLSFVSLYGYEIEMGDFDVTFDSFPETIDEFVEMRNEYAVTPSGGAAMFVIAFVIYSEDKDLGEQCMTAVLVNDGTLLVDDKNGYGGKAPGYWADTYLAYVDTYDRIAYSYLSGTGPDNGYVPDDSPYMVETSTNRYSITDEDTVKVFVECSGASSARPLILKRNTKGIWKVSNFSSLVVGIMPITVTDDGDDI